MTQPLIELGGTGPTTLHLAPANGFPPPVYLPFVRPLCAHYRVVTLPPRALWQPAPPPAAQGQHYDWRILTDDLLEGMHQYQLTDVIALGHSFGGIASLLAVLREPQRFKALVLLDPTLLPPEGMRYFSTLRQNGEVDSFPLIASAQRRRKRFESAQAAYENFKSKAQFADWPDETMRLYAEHGTRPAADGDGVELVWSPEWEAFYYRAFYTETWDDLPRLRGLLPILVLRGTNSDTFFEDAAQRLRTILPEITYVEIEGHGHLFPQSAPEQSAQIILAWLQENDLRAELE